MTTECVCPNCRQLFQSSSLSRVADYCSECWDAWRQGNGSFERRAKDATIKQLVDALEGSVNWIVEEIESRDGGFWDARKVPEVIAARKALAAYRETQEKSNG